MKTIVKSKPVLSIKIARQYIASKNLSKNYITNLLTTAKSCKYLIVRFYTWMGGKKTPSF